MRLLLIYAILISNSTIGQTLKERLDGDWVCIGISDLHGASSKGKYGGSREYLRFNFKKNKLRISETPYDFGIFQNLTYDNAKGQIEILHDIPIELPSGLPEQNYKIKTLDNERLILSTLNEKNQSIEYLFIKQNRFANRSENTILDNGLLIIKLADLSNKFTTIKNNIGEWIINNDSIHLGPSPIYSGKGYFGDAFANALILPSDFKTGELSNELICEFSVSAKGAYDFKIEKGISEPLDKEVLRVLGKLSKYWKLNEMNPRTLTMKFHMYFIKINEEFVSPFKID
jgi:hypothetical protein